MRAISIALTLALAALLGACVAAAPLDQSVAARTNGMQGYSTLDEQLYLQRFAELVKSFQTGVGLDHYDLLVPVAGKPDHGLPVAAEAARTIAPAALEKARDYAANNNSSTVIVWRNGAIELEHYFGATRPDTLLNAKSFAKPLTAIAIGRALELGAIKSLDQPVADFIPQWRSDPRKAKILVRHLLDMRSGFLPQAAATQATDILNRAYLHPRHDEVIINDYPLVAEPGSRYDYANATSEMVAPVIRAATGEPYEEFVAREVLQRIGASGGRIWMNRSGGTAHSGCCILLPARDWLRLSILLLDDGKWHGHRLLPKGYVAQMRTGTPQNRYFGLGIWLAGDYMAERGFANPDRKEYTTLHGEPYQAGDLFLFDGNANQVSYVVPSEGLIVLRMGGSPPRGSRWDNSILPNTILRGIVKDRGSSVAQQELRK